MADSLKPQYDELVARWSALTPERREELLAEFLPDYVYNSEKIENSELTYATVKQIVETGSVTGYTGDVQLLIEKRCLCGHQILASVYLDREADGCLCAGDPGVRYFHVIYIIDEEIVWLYVVRIIDVLFGTCPCGIGV